VLGEHAGFLQAANSNQSAEQGMEAGETERSSSIFKVKGTWPQLTCIFAVQATCCAPSLLTHDLGAKLLCQGLTAAVRSGLLAMLSKRLKLFICVETVDACCQQHLA
jgi:hypothetical protein